MHVILYILLFLPFAVLQADQPVTLTVSAPLKTTKTPLVLLAVNPTLHLTQIAQRVVHNLSCENQKLSGFKMHYRDLEKLPTKRYMRDLYQEGFSLIVLLFQKDTHIEWRLYDSYSSTMYDGKRLKMTSSAHHNADIISDQIWHILTGQEGFFCTKIAFCKEFIHNKKMYKNLCTLAPQDSHENVLVHKSKLLAPRWHSNPAEQLLFYSVITPSNVRLMGVSLQGNHYRICNFDGITMLPSLSIDGTKMAYCLTQHGKAEIYCYTQDQGTTKIEKLPLLQGNNISPTLLESGDLIFCSDVSGTPRIYYYVAESQEVQPITTQGYCSSPSWCSKTKSIAYCKLIDGTMQVFAYDTTSKKHTQLTFSPGNKDECCWSACGNYIAFEKNDRIALFNLLTKEEFFITAAHDRCSYPAWSPSFAHHHVTC